MNHPTAPTAARWPDARRTPWGVAFWLLALPGCAGGAYSPSPRVSTDAGANLPPDSLGEVCASINDCPQSQICEFPIGTVLGDGGTARGICARPSGTCTPGDTVNGQPRLCFPDARCDASRGAPRCTFASIPLQAFQTAERITLSGPTERDAVTGTSSVTLNWQPPSRSVGEVSTSVAVIMNRPPMLRVETRQIQNTSAVQWIWSSAEPGGAVEGRVTFDQGRRGIQHDGALNPARWGRQEFLPDGIYFWFVFNVANGQVTRSSGVQWFRVGPEVSPGQCRSAIDCTLPGEVPESFGCIANACQRRCASDIDCAAVGGRCAYHLSFPSEGRTSRHSGFCDFTGLPDAGRP